MELYELVGILTVTLAAKLQCMDFSKTCFQQQVVDKLSCVLALFSD